jgi:hypothetical protein
MTSYDTDGKISAISSAGTKSFTYDSAFRIPGVSDTSTGADSCTLWLRPSRATQERCPRRCRKFKDIGLPRAKLSAAQAYRRARLQWLLLDCGRAHAAHR